MSLLFGIVDKRGEPIDNDWLDLMAATTRLPRCKLPKIWIEKSFGFGIAQRYDTPQDHLVAQPFHDDEAGVHLIASGRLDYRVDLARKLDFAEVDLARTADVTLMQLAWRKWREDCALHLEGDWTMAVWDRTRQHLALLRDSTGISALHYVDHPRYFAFATRIDSLLSLPFVTREVNQERLTEILAICVGDGSSTCYRDVVRLPPAAMLTIGMHKDKRVTSYRDPLVVDPALPQKGDYLEQFVQIFERAVAERMRSVGPVGLTLSSGYDSSSVAVAANKIATQTGVRLPAYSATPLNPQCEVAGRLANESPLILKTCEKLGQLNVRFNDASDVTPVQGMVEVINAVGEPSHAVMNHYWINSLLRQAVQEGTETLLTGQLGNATISWQGTDRRAWDDLLAGDFSSAKRRWRRKRERSSFLQTVKSEVLSPGLRRLRLAALPAYLARQWVNASYLLPSAEWMDDVKARLIAQRRQGLMDSRKFVIATTCRNTNPLWEALGNWSGVAIRDPTSDERLIRFCLSLPDSQYQNASEQRLLAGRYLRNSSLTWVIDGHRKGLQAADIGPRLAADRQATETLLERIANTKKTQVLDRTRVQEVWKTLAISDQSSMHSYMVASRWLRAFSVEYFILYAEMSGKMGTQGLI